MKLSLKEWFLHEDVTGVDGDIKASSSAKSSTNVNICIEGEGLDEKSLSSYTHPTTHLAKKFSKKKGVKDPWALANYVKHKNEGALKEYEDPTSSKHDAEDDSKWSGPMSPKERMPHEEPHDMAQERSADGWKESRKSSDSHYPGSKPSALKHFFGAEPYPKSSEMEEQDSAEPDSEKHMKDVEYGLPRDERHDSRRSSKHSSKMSEAAPDDDEDFLKSLEGDPKSSKKSSAAEPEENPTLDWSQMDDPEFLKSLETGETVPPPPPAKAKSSKMPKMGDVVKTGDDKPYSTFDADAIEPFEPPKGDPYAGPGEGDLTWDEVRATHPEAAQEIERDLGPDELEGATFQKKPDGRIYMTTGQGKRMTYLGPKLGWSDLDDGESPSGEF